MYIFSALLLRSLEGVASSMIIFTVFSFANNTYKHRSLEYIGYITIMEGLGMVLGAPLGTLFYQIAGYDTVFYGTGLLLLLCSLVYYIVLSPTLNEVPEEDSENEYNISTWELLKNKRYLFALLTTLVAFTL